MSTSRTVAIVGGGIAGATAAWTLSKYDDDLTIHVFDQGRRGPGGRASSRSYPHGAGADGAENGDGPMRFDHGCQFFRADTPQFKEMIEGEWSSFVREWTGRFQKSQSLSSDKEFFGMPSMPPFYVAADGMDSLPKNVLEHAIKNLEESLSSSSLRVFSGTRVAQIERVESSNKWRLHGTSGTAAFHDTSEKIAQEQYTGKILGEYDAVLLTDLSSSFEGWHRASAGVPEEFSRRVRQRAGARMPLFSALVAFKGETNVPFDAASFDDGVIWFAARSGSKPGMAGGAGECWTIVSTPAYAMAKIEETPMQDPKTGEFIPQSDDYLTSIPGPDLYNAFQRSLTHEDGILGDNALGELPAAMVVDAQRWGSAMPGHHRIKNDERSPTRKVLGGVAYDSGRFPLAPTQYERMDDGDDGVGDRGRSFLADEELMLFQAGDMVSNHTPGLEGAALSGCRAAECLRERLLTARE